MSADLGADLDQLFARRGSLTAVGAARVALPQGFQ